MLVYGYTDEKLVMPADLPIDTVARLGIDVWQMDLFDPDPLRLPILSRSNTQVLNFRKLRDASFAYVGSGQLTLVNQEGLQAACLQSNEWRIRFDHTVMHNSTLSKRSFAEHFAEYLSFAEHLPPECMMSPIRFWKSVSVQGKDIRFDCTDFRRTTLQQPFFYVGEMFHVLPTLLPFVLPEQINWIFKRFAKWSPLVFGEGLRPFTHQLKKELKVKLNGIDAVSMRQMLHAIPDLKYEQSKNCWKLDGWSYDFFLVSSVHVNTAADVASFFHPALSLDCRAACAENSLQCTRIALFDNAKQQARTLTSSFNTVSQDTMGLVLAKEGIKLLNRGYIDSAQRTADEECMGSRCAAVS
jgi:hypothetical protein